MIEGKRCLSLEEIDRQKYLIIITIDHPEELKKQLMDQGYQCVTDYYEIADILYQVLPDKKKLLVERKA